MKRFLSLLLCLTLLAGCAPASPAANTDPTLRLLATTYPVYLFTTAVVGTADGVQVDLLVNSQTSCLHDYTLTVNDMKLVDKADIILMNGAGLEDFMADALAQSSAETIACAESIPLLESFGQSHDDDHASHDHDPHIWMSQENARAMLETIASGLSALDPDHADLYAANLSAALAQLPGETLATSTLSCPYLITFHDGFQYFAQANGLTLLKAIEEESGSEASAAEIKEIISLINEYQIPAIFTEKNSSDATAQAISRETGCKVYQLDMIMSGTDSGIDGYLSAMNANYTTILEALA